VRTKFNQNRRRRRSTARGSAPCSPSARLALIFAILAVAFGSGTVAAATYEALSDLEARGVMDGTW
jgi:hypothetical protein